MKKQKYTLFQVFFLLTQYGLIRLGDIPLQIFSFILRLLVTILSASSRQKKELSDFLKSVVFLPKLKKHQKKNTPRVKNTMLISSKRRVVFTTLGIFIALFFYTWFIIKIVYDLPSPSRLYENAKPFTTEIYDRKGNLLYRIYDDKNRSFVKLDDLPQNLINATIAIEDKNFYHHLGVDFGGIIRALYHNLTSKSASLQGASTITQQLIKNTLLTQEKTYQRKIKEASLALITERLYNKRQILEMYFNETPYGGPIWGIKAASQTFFGKEPKDLTLAESAFLAGLPASPTEFSPYGSTSFLGTERQKQVLQRMVEEKFITREQFQKAIEEKITFRPNFEEIKAPHFVFYVKDYLSKRYGAGQVSKGGLKVITTLDLNLQKDVEDVVKNEVESLSLLNVKNGSAMVVDPKTGQILAMVGSRDYNYPGFGNFNATIALRQPGSSIKPITYATAFKMGYTPGNTILDIPTTFKNAWESYSPVNYDGSFHGPVSLRSALGSSFNIPAVKILSLVGIDSMLKTAKDLGITTFTEPQRYGLSLTLGGAEVKMVDMMAAFSTFSQMGTYHNPTPILEVKDSSGNILEQYTDNGKKVLQPEVAFMINDILSDNNARSAAFGTNSLLNLSPNIVAVKTGTTDSKRDNWTFGYTNDFVVGVWVGNPDNSPMDRKLSSGITGAAPIWNKITKKLLETNPGTGFVKSGGIIDIFVDGRRDIAISGLQTKTIATIKIDKENNKIIYSDQFSQMSTPSAQTVSQKTDPLQ